MVCSITLGPANPISAFGSAKMTSPNHPNDAATPPVVGCSMSEMYGRARRRNRAHRTTHELECKATDRNGVALQLSRPGNEGVRQLERFPRGSQAVPVLLG